MATGQPWYYDAEKWAALRQRAPAEADLMRAYAHGEGCLMEVLQQALDDPDRRPCGRCSVCTGELPRAGRPTRRRTVVAARRFLRGHDVVVEPRKLWPPAAGRKGRIVGMAPGRAVAFADDPAWNDELATLRQADRPAPRRSWMALVAGAEAVGEDLAAARWRWSPCRRGVPDAAARVAEHVAAVGRLPLVDALAVSGPPPTAEAASASGPGTCSPDHALSRRCGFDGPVLLVDDTIRTRWTATVASARLADAGATAVLPLVIHQLP